MDERENKPAKINPDRVMHFGDFAFGHSGFRPLISLPNSRARQAGKILGYLDKAGIVLFVVSAVLFGLGRLGMQLSYVIGGSVIVSRGLIILAGRFTITKTTIVPTKTGEEPQIDSEGKTGDVFDNIYVQPSIDNGKLKIRFKNESIQNVMISAEAESENNRVVIPKRRAYFELKSMFEPLQRTTEPETDITTKFELEATNKIAQSAKDTISVNVAGSTIDGGMDKSEVQFDETLKLDIVVKNADDVATDEYRYEIVRK